VGLLARPARYEVEGLSMAPGLMPGDVVSSNAFPVIDRLRQPARFERWTLDAPGAGTAVKRVGGLPGEVVALRGGDLAADGRVVLKGPPALAEIATEVARHDGRRSLVLPGGEILDDAAFATEVNRELLPVRDAGIVAVVRAGPAPGNEPSVVIAVGPRRITWRLAPADRACFVAGRLDGHMVATAWRLPSDAPLPDRGCLPTPAAVAWSHREPWPVAETTDDHAPGLAFDVADGTVDVERLRIWRDVLHRAGADGRAEWRLGADEYFILGDFPTGSVDSRHWGPLGRPALRHRVAPHR
jgi:hypothetical protein